MEKRGRGRPKKMLEASGGISGLTMIGEPSVASGGGAISLEGPSVAPRLMVVLKITEADIAKWGGGVGMVASEGESEAAVAAAAAVEKGRGAKLIFRKGDFHQRISRLMGGLSEGGEWGQGGPVCCFNCGCACPPDRAPLGIPDRWVEEESRFYLYAPMCSPACGLAWLDRGGERDIDQCSLETLADRRQLYLMMLRKGGLDVDQIGVQHSRFLHQRYGGPLSDRDYWGEQSREFNYELFTNMVRPVPRWVEETGMKMRTHRKA
jgi:hypothetical protein